MTNLEVEEFLRKIKSIQILMRQIAAGAGDIQEKEKTYAELRAVLKRYFSHYNITDPNNFSSLLEFYGYYRSKMGTDEEKRDLVKKIYEKTENDINSIIAEERSKKTDTVSKEIAKKSQQVLVAYRSFDDIISHPLIKQASQDHFKNKVYRTAVLDAMIRLEEMVKEKAKFPKDNRDRELSGVPLMHRVFDADNPILSWCKGSRQIERDELEGYKHIFAGAMQGIRDPKAHSIFEIKPMRALKLLTLATLLAELVDASKYINQD